MYVSVKHRIWQGDQVGIAFSIVSRLVSHSSRFGTLHRNTNSIGVGMGINAGYPTQSVLSIVRLSTTKSKSRLYRNPH